jgi:hypothetical protein
MTEIEVRQIVLEDEYNGEKKIHTITHIGDIEKIEEINAIDFNKESFKLNHLQQSKPLVIRDALNVFDCGSAYKDWSLEYLSKKCGQNKVFVRRNTLADDYKTGKAYQVQEIEFNEYIHDLVQDNPMSKNSYLAVQNLRKAFPQIADELKMPEFVEKLHAGPFMWIARSGHYEYTHMDPDDNVLMVLKGRKIVRLYGSDVNAMMPNKLGAFGRTIQSQINCDILQKDLDNDVMKSYQQTKCHYCLLKEGDLLYFPAFWWHQVKSPELTISINAFFGDGGQNDFITKILKSKQRDALLYWVYNIIAQNLSFPSFPRVLVNLKDSLRNFLFKQWHESLDDSQINELHSNIISYFKFEERLNELNADESLKNKSKNPPQLRIRGLLQREPD